MTHKMKFNRAELEKAECYYFRDCISTAEEKLSANLGLLTKDINNAYAYSFGRHDILAFNRILHFGIDKNVTEQDIKQVIDFYGYAGAPRFFVPVSPIAKPASLEQMLLDNGFTHYNNWAKLYKVLDSHVPEYKTGVNIRTADEAEKDLFSKIIERSFDWPHDVAAIYSQSINRKGWIHYIAYIDDKPVSAAAVFCRNSFASLVIAGTLPQYRGRGIQTHMIKKRLNDAYKNKCKIAVVETGENRNDEKSSSFRNLERFGFETAYLRKNYIYQF